MNPESPLLLFGKQSERLFFRELLDSDFPTWLRFCESLESLKYMSFPENDSPTQKCEMWFSRIFDRYANNLGGMNVLINKNTNEFVGQCGLLIHDIDEVRELEIGYSLMPDFRGQGYAKEAAKKCRDYAFENNLSESLISIIHPENHSSIQVALRNGMNFHKQTIYRNTAVNIYRITQSQWLDMQNR